MKILLPIVILTFSLSAFAQDNIPSINQQTPTPQKNENAGLKLNVLGEPLSGINFERNFGLDIQHQLKMSLSSIQLYDSIYYWQWDTLILSWKTYQKEVDFVYDPRNNLTSSKTLIWNGSGWEISSRRILTFDSHDNIRSFTFQHYDGSGWENSSRWIFTYDANDNLTSFLQQYWHYYAWESQNQYLYTYDAQNNLTTEVYQIYVFGNLQNSTQALYSYDDNNHLLRILNQNWDGLIWVDDRLITYNYETDNTLISILSQYLNAGNWINSGLTTNEYDSSHNLTKSTSQIWQDSAWVNSVQYIYTYDANNNQTNVTVQEWIAKTWLNYYLGHTTYNEDNFPITWTSKYFNDNGNKVISGDSTHYYFHTITGTNDLAQEFDNLLVSPNPTSGKLTITSPGIAGEIEIYNLSGKMVAQTMPILGQTSAEIDLTFLGPGLYFVVMRTGSKVYGSKVVLQ